MYHPTTRVLAVLELLQTQRQLTSRELAERLEVNPRSIRRYIIKLQDLGIPVDSLRGRYGGYRLLPGFKLPPLMLNNEEALAVTLGLLLARRADLSVEAPAVESALAKISRVLPLDMQDNVRAVASSVSFAEMPTDDRSASTSLADLAEAARAGNRVQLRYQDVAGRETERLFDPYGLSFVSRRWYVAGYCHLRNDLRTLRIDRIQQIEISDQTFTRPEGFDPLDYTTTAIATMPGPFDVEVRLHTSVAIARQYIPPTFGTLEETGRGTIFRCTPWDLNRVARFLAGLEFDFTVHRPNELLEALEQLARRLIRLVGPGSVAPTLVDDVSERPTANVTSEVVAEEIDDIVTDVGR